MFLKRRRDKAAENGSSAAPAGKATSSRGNPPRVQPLLVQGLIGHTDSEKGRCFRLVKRDGVADKIAFTVGGLNF